MIFLDANVPMYLIGTDPEGALQAQTLLARLSVDGDALVTSAEVLQEILHRYRAVDRLTAVQRAFDLVDGVVDGILPVEREDVERAHALCLARPALQARDCLHLATMERHGIRRIASFDRGFDGIPGIERVA